MHARRSRLMAKWANTLLLIVFVLCMPLWIPAALVMHALDRHRLRKAARAFACVTCGRSLGREALARADEAWSEQVAELMRQHPDVRFRLLRTLDAICPI